MDAAGACAALHAKDEANELGSIQVGLDRGAGRGIMLVKWQRLNYVMAK